jgi:hypothetical protein
MPKKISVHIKIWLSPNAKENFGAWKSENSGACKKMAKSSEASPYCFGLAKSTVAGSSLSLLVLSEGDVPSSCSG